MDVTAMKQVQRFDSNYLANPLFWSLCHYIGHLSIKKKKIRAFTFFRWQRTANLFGETRQTLKSPQEKTASRDLFTFSSSQNPTLFCIQYFNGARYCLIRTQCVLYLHHVIFINDQVDFERLALVSVWCSPVDDVLCSLPFHTLMFSFYCCLTLVTVNNSQMKKGHDQFA